MKSASLGTLIAASVALAVTAPAWGQVGPPPPSTLEDITGCSLEHDTVFIAAGRDAAARRYKYAWDASIDALCNAKGFAIDAPAKASAAQTTAPAAPAAPVGTATAKNGSPASDDFPADTQALAADGVTRKISGKTFDWQMKNGTKVRLEYKSNGYVFVNAPGYANSGPWRVEESRICSHMRGAAASCNEVREQGQRLYLKRDNGEVIALDPR